MNFLGTKNEFESATINELSVFTEFFFSVHGFRSSCTTAQSHQCVCCLYIYIYIYIIYL